MGNCRRLWEKEFQTSAASKWKGRFAADVGLASWSLKKIFPNTRSKSSRGLVNMT